MVIWLVLFIGLVSLCICMSLPGRNLGGGGVGLLCMWRMGVDVELVFVSSNVMALLVYSKKIKS